MIQLIVFDMAGTTINENNVVYKTLQKSINKFGYNFSLEEVLLHGAGKEKHQAIKDIIASQPSTKKNEVESLPIFNDFSELLKITYQNLEVATFPETELVFKKLKERGVKIALNTGYNRKTALQLLNKLNWKEGNQYDALITASDVEKGRPEADMIYKAMELFHISEARNVVKVGDSIIDIQEGKNAICGITIGVTTGAHTKEQLKSVNPTFIIDSLPELLQKLF
ncbi:HAD family hydrolase [Lutibacter profundi]|uniref:HAD family hydrolase n=1 Tax=Lutibacter profundi TaxID=1622118 RepID=A0A0X8G535_9FLAO|nr:phosphonatase-like hydrolase [Lutibacter profundi]AMC10206.1 HAD family hydrolase [Lutibacter profundi]